MGGAAYVTARSRTRSKYTFTQDVSRRTRYTLRTPHIKSPESSNSARASPGWTESNRNSGSFRDMKYRLGFGAETRHAVTESQSCTSTFSFLAIQHLPTPAFIRTDTADNLTGLKTSHDFRHIRSSDPKLRSHFSLRRKHILAQNSNYPSFGFCQIARSFWLAFCILATFFCRLFSILFCILASGSCNLFCNLTRLHNLRPAQGRQSIVDCPECHACTRANLRNCRGFIGNQFMEYGFDICPCVLAELGKPRYKFRKIICFGCASYRPARAR